MHFRPSILACSTRIGLQTVSSSFVPQEAVSYDIPLQRVLMWQLFLLEQLDQLAIQGNLGFLDAQQESFPFLNKTPARTGRNVR